MKRFLKGFGLILVLVGVGIISALAVMSLLLRQEEVRVPDLSGRDVVSAIEIVSREGLQLKIDRREPHPTIPRDIIISQTPSPGAGIKKGRPIRLVVSQGPSEMQTPNAVGEHFRKAEISFRQAGFFPGTISRTWSDDVPRDMVIAQDPQAGSPLGRGEKINILVSLGKKTQKFVTPKLLGKRAEDAVRTVERMGLQHRITYKTSGNASAGSDRVVINQKPGPEYPIPADSTVELVVSK